MPEISPRVSLVILSSDPPQTLIDQVNAQTYKDFELILAKEKGFVTAMNIALVKAKGDIFVRIDDDVELPATWLEELVKPFSDPAVCGVTGPTFVPERLRSNRDSIRLVNPAHPFIAWLMDHKELEPALILRCGSVSYGSNFEWQILSYKPIDHLEGTNWAMRTNLIREVGGFDPKFGGVGEWFDTDVEQKILKLGPERAYRLVYNFNAYLWHLLHKGRHYEERNHGWGRISNWLRFHWRHSKFHYKKVIWLAIMCAYFIKKYADNIRSK